MSLNNSLNLDKEIQNAKEKIINQNMNKKTFCKECGSPLLERYTNEEEKHNIKTGERIKEKYCSNLKCYIGCRDNSGHFHSRQKFLSCNENHLYCTRCGFRDTWSWGDG